MFARLVRQNWYYVFQEQFKRETWDRIVNTLGVIEDARHRISHPTPDGLDEGYVLARLYDIAEILGRIDAVEKKRAVEKIRERLMHSANADTAASDAVAVEITRETAEMQQAVAEAIRRAEEREAAAAEATRKADEREAVAGRAIRRAEEREMEAAEYVREAAARETAARAAKTGFNPVEPTGRLAGPAPSPETMWEHWREVLGHLRGTKGPQGYNIDALLRDCRRNSVRMSADRTTLVLPVSDNANLERMLQELSTRWVGDAIADAIYESFGE